MSYRVRYTREAHEALRRLFTELAARDKGAARRARATIKKGIELLKEFPFTCRKALPGDSFLRELVIPFGGAGYVVLFEIDDSTTVTILAVRHQREEDFH